MALRRSRVQVPSDPIWLSAGHRQYAPLLWSMVQCVFVGSGGSGVSVNARIVAVGVGVGPAALLKYQGPPPVQTPLKFKSNGYTYHVYCPACGSVVRSTL